MAADKQSPTASALHGEVRFAGLLYAVNIGTGVFSLACGPAQLFAGAAGAEIVRSIAGKEMTLRLLIARNGTGPGLAGPAAQRERGAAENLEKVP
jgi:hypothetical protein